MDAAHEMALRGAAHGTAVRADRQTAGRGTRGRNWASDDGGLWLSVIARPQHTDALEALSVRVGLAVCAVLEASCPVLPRLQLKWPNDILLDGRKMAGILCEARWGGGQCQWVVVGLGLNVRNVIPDGLRGVATALATWAADATVDALAAPVAAAVAFAAREAGPLTEAELRAFALRDALAGAHIVEPVRGSAEGITAGGALRVRTEAGPVREILAGVVTAAS